MKREEITPEDPTHCLVVICNIIDYRGPLGNKLFHMCRCTIEGYVCCLTILDGFENI